MVKKDRDHFFHLLDQELPDILGQLSSLSQIFELHFDPCKYEYVRVNAFEKVLLDFLGGCPGLPHSQWGQDLEKRLASVGEFVSSEAYQNYCLNLNSGGSVIEQDIFEVFPPLLKTPDLPLWVSSLVRRLQAAPVSEQPFGVYICVRDIHEGLLQGMRKLLLHEWIHLLLFSNDLKFQALENPPEEAWLWDEGLTTWLEYATFTQNWDCEGVLHEKLAWLNERQKPPSVTGYFEKGLCINDYFRAFPKAQWADALRARFASPPWV